MVNFSQDFVGIEHFPPYISFKEFKDLYNLYIFDIKYQKEHLSAQEITIDFQFRQGYDVKALNMTAYALVLKNKMISVSTDGSKMFDIIS